MTSLMAERVLGEAPVSDQPRLARDAYSYLHLPMVAGTSLYLPALATLALLSFAVVGLVVWETTTIADTRYRIRHEQG